jgi:alkyl sulfatase BDS1-like metallo-beta-lactamase superfamily hydrolase
MATMTSRPTDATRQGTVVAAEHLPLHDRQEVTAAGRGLVARSADRQVRAAGGRRRA